MTHTITRFAKIEIDQLFGRTKLTFQKSEAKGVMIGFGLNGCGKTTMFDLLNALFRLDFSRILRTDFAKLYIEGVAADAPFKLTVSSCLLEDEPALQVRLVTDESGEDGWTCDFSDGDLDHRNRDMILSDFGRDRRRRHSLRRQRRSMPRGRGHFPRRRTVSDSFSEFSEFIKEHLKLNELQFNKRIESIHPDGREYFEDAFIHWRNQRAHLGADEEANHDLEILLFLFKIYVKFVEDSRLTLLGSGEDLDEDFIYESDNSKLEDKILEVIREPARFFRQRMEQSSSTLVDRTLSKKFGDRKLEEIIEAQWEEFLGAYQDIFPKLKESKTELTGGNQAERVESIQHLVETLATEYLTTLQSIGLSSYEVKHVKNQDSNFYEANKSLIQLLIFQYSLDVLEAVSIFLKDGVLTKADNFVSMAQSKLPTEMRLSVEPDRVTITIQPNGSKISLKKLSSGQQHLLTLLYYLCWETEEHSILLIDEPEISLNLQWQEQLGQDLERISTDHNVQFLLATHSPYIFGDKYDEFGVEFRSIVTYEE